MNLMPFLIMKAAQDANKRHSSSSKKSSSSSQKSSSSSYSYSKPSFKLENEINSFSNHRMNACILNLINENPEYKKALEAYISKMKEANEKRISELHAELETYCEPSAEMSEKYNQVFSELSNDLPFSAKLIGDPDSDYGKFWYVKPNPGGIHASYYTAPETLSIDGVILTKKEFESNTNPFKAMYDSKLAVHKNYKENYETLKAKVEDLEKQKIRLKLSSKKREELERAKAEFKDAKYIYDKMTGYLASAEKYDNLSPEQTEKIAKFFEVNGEFKELHNKVFGCREKCLEITGYGRPTQIQDLILKSKTEAYEALSEEDRAKIDEIPSVIATKIVSLTDQEFTKLATGSLPSSSAHSASSVFYDIAEITLEEARKLYSEKVAEQDASKKAQQGQPGEE